MKKTILIFTISLCCGFQILFSGSAWSEQKYTIAFSQTTNTGNGTVRRLKIWTIPGRFPID